MLIIWTLIKIILTKINGKINLIEYDLLFLFKSLTLVLIFYGWNLFEGYIFCLVDDKVGQIICVINLNISKINGKMLTWLLCGMQMI